MRRLIACAVIALVAAFVGPRLAGPQNHSAGTAFAYEPPEGFTETKSLSAPESTQSWTSAAKDARVVKSHSAKEMLVEESALALLARDMTKAFEDTCAWGYRRHEMRTRADGARVGLIEGDCESKVDLAALGLPARNLRSRKLQLIFPDDTGTSIVTASYPTEQAAQWEPLFEATIAKARGVATRVPPPEQHLYVAWGGAAFVIAWLATALIMRRQRKDAPE